MNNLGYRINGGGGFSINDPELIIYFDKSDTTTIIDRRAEKGISQDEKRSITLLIDKIIVNYKLTYSIKLEISDSLFSSHIGLGSGTALKLAIIEGLFLTNNISADRDLLISLTGRGGTSGVGINTYFDGGFSFDLGRPNKMEQLLPSSSNEYRYSKPLQIIKGRVPEWEIAIGLLNNEKSFSGKNEEAFFLKNASIDTKDVKDILYEFVAGVIPSLFENDYDTFCKSLKIIQSCKWKAKERELFNDRLAKIENTLYSKGVDAIAFSSMGPCILIVSKNIEKLFDDNDIRNLEITIFRTSFRNTGREIIFC